MKLNDIQVLTEATANAATKHKDKISKNHKIQTMWQLEAKLKKDGLLTEKLALAFFCPVYFAGQLKVKALLDKKDEHGEMIMFPLPAIEDKARIKIGLSEMKRLGIKDPEKLLNEEDGVKSLPTYSELPGIEGVGSDKQFYEFVAYEAVQLGAFQLVPKAWLNGGDPYNQSYKFPGEKGYSPYWRVPPFKEFKKMRPKLADMFEEKDGEITKVDFSGM